MKEEDKCEKAELQHAWRNGEQMLGFSTLATQECANCGLKRTKHSHMKEWWSYSDDRPSEEIVTIRPV